MNGTLDIPETTGRDAATSGVPDVLTEGIDFHNELPDRLYLDSDPEFHLNPNIIVSYLLFFHVDNRMLAVSIRPVGVVDKQKTQYQRP